MEMRKDFRLVALICAAVLMVAAGIYYYLTALKVKPEQMIRETVQNALQARGYRYTVTADFKIAGKKKTWIKVRGEKTSTDAHFKGTILGTPVEIYQTGTRSYTLDPVSNKWIVLDGTDLDKQQLYMAEIDPLSNFKFKGIDSPRLVGTEKVGKRKCWVVEFRSQKVESRVLDMYWKNITYRFWVDKRGWILRKAMATAENKNSPGTFLSLIVEFQDFNKRIDINPPQ